MNSALNQLYVFIACVALGGVFGILFSVSRLIYSATGNRIIKTITDIVTCIICTFAYLIYSYTLKFPSFRVYMPVGVFAGIAAYMKSFHIIVANLMQMAYNRIREKIRLSTKRKKRVTIENDRREI